MWALPRNSPPSSHTVQISSSDSNSCSTSNEVGVECSSDHTYRGNVARTVSDVNENVVSDNPSTNKYKGSRLSEIVQEIIVSVEDLLDQISDFSRRYGGSGTPAGCIPNVSEEPNEPTDNRGGKHEGGLMNVDDVHPNCMIFDKDFRKSSQKFGSELNRIRGTKYSVLQVFNIIVVQLLHK